MVFRDIYNETRTVFSSLVGLNDEELNAIENEANQDEIRNQTNRHLFLISMASLTIIISPYAIAKVYNSLDLIVDYLSSKKGHYLEQYIDVTNFSLGFGSVAILMYLFLFPKFKIFLKRFQPKSTLYSNISTRLGSLYSNINTKQSNYILGSIIGCYLVLGFILYLIQLNALPYADEVVNIFKYYLILPLAVITILMVMFVLIIVCKPFLRHIDNYQHSSNDRVELAFILLKILHRLKDYDRSYIIPKETSSEIIRNLNRASSLISDYPSRLIKGSSNQILLDNFTRASNFVDTLIVDFQTSSASEIQNVLERLISFVNVVLKGNLSGLPKVERETYSVTRVNKIRFYHFILLAIYLTLPVIVVILLNVTFNVTFSEYNQSLLKILYMVWAFVGVFSNPVILTSENKELIRDIVKSLFGRG